MLCQYRISLKRFRPKLYPEGPFNSAIPSSTLIIIKHWCKNVTQSRVKRWNWDIIHFLPFGNTTSCFHNDDEPCAVCQRGVIYCSLIYQSEVGLHTCSLKRLFSLSSQIMGSELTFPFLQSKHVYSRVFWLYSFSECVPVSQVGSLTVLPYIIVFDCYCYYTRTDFCSSSYCSG